MQGYRVLLGAALVATCVVLAAGHGMVMDPPNRSSMWRFFPGLPVNWDDNEIYCGGFGVQWDINGGKCGLCGDDYRMPRPRPNENTGKYGQGQIGKEYKSGSLIEVAVNLETNHWGYFNFSICKLEDRTKPEPNEECFQQLRLGDGSLTYHLPNGNNGYINLSLQLPAGLTCEQCVLRWWYHTGNSWGNCEDGSEGMGCGPQETFMSCSDIAIV